jgi:hypothetical protein
MDADTRELLQRLVVACERIADHLAPVVENRERHPATLTTAIYDRDERERSRLGETLRRKEPIEERRTFEASED